MRSKHTQTHSGVHMQAGCVATYKINVYVHSGKIVYKSSTERISKLVNIYF